MQRAPQQPFFYNNKLHFSDLTTNQVVLGVPLLIPGSSSDSLDIKATTLIARVDKIRLDASD